MKEPHRQKRLRLLAEIKRKPAVAAVYFILRLIVLITLVSSAMPWPSAP